MATRKKAKAIKLGEHSGPLRLIAFSDWRVQDIGLLVEEISRLPATPDLILYGGDDISRFREPNRNLFEDLARCSRYGICAVSGNDDPRKDLISGDRVFDVHDLPVILGKYAIVGLEHAPVTDDGFAAGTCYSEKQATKHLANQKRAVSGKQIIVLSHAPPFRVLDKSIRLSRDGRPRSIGSRSLRRFIRSNRSVALVVCGHAHRCGGRHERLGRTMVVNAASHDRIGNAGRFAIATMNPRGKIEVEWREIWEVACVAGIGPQSAARLRAVGIRTVQEFAKSDRAALAEALPKPPPRPLEILVARARAFVKRRPVLVRPLELPPGPEIFLDIETDSAGGCKYVWLIGLCIGRKGPYQAFFAETPGDERRILDAFAEFAVRKPGASFLTFSGSKLEERALHAGFSRHGLSTSLCSRIVNLCHGFQQTVALPINSESIKEVARMFGFRYRHPGLDGLGVALLYEQNYIALKHAGRRRALRQKLLEYNEDDVRSLPFILNAIASLPGAVDAQSLFPTAEQRTV